MLANCGAPSQTSRIMKTLPRTFTVAVLAVLAVIAVLSLRGSATGSGQEIPANKKFKITKPITCGHPGTDGYCQLKVSQQAFDGKLNTLKNNGGDYHIKFLCKAGEQPIEPYDHHHHPLCAIRTAKVTKSEVANTTAADASAGNDPNAVNHLYSNNQADIDAVLACFK
jgi:hypothetical protein